MFAKALIFIFALVASVNAAPIAGYGDMNIGISSGGGTDGMSAGGSNGDMSIGYGGGNGGMNMGRRSGDQNVGGDNGGMGIGRDNGGMGIGRDYGYMHRVSSKRDISLEDLANDLANFVDSLNLDDIHFNAAAPLPKRDLYNEFIDRINAIFGKRDNVDLDTLGSQILDGLKSHGLTEYLEHFSTRIQRLKDLSGDVSQEHIAAEANNLVLEYRQVLAGLSVNKPVKARDVVIDVRVLSQLQAFVNNTVNLLRALNKTDAVNTFMSQVNQLRTEAQNGTLDAGDLLNAARNIVLSVL